MTLPEADVRPIGRWSLVWRVLAAVALVVLLLNGSLRLENEAWPFGPMSQYAFSPSADDTVEITRVYARLADGQRVEVPLRSETAGIRRADVEAHIGDIERDPSLMRTVGDGWRVRNPTEPRPVELFLVTDRTHLFRGRVQSTDQVTLAAWRVDS